MKNNLQSLFQKYNKKYFNNGIPYYKVVAVSIPIRPDDPSPPWGKCNKRKREILIDLANCQFDKNIKATILHEMVHAKLPHYGHGYAFNREVNRLMSLKAPIFPQLHIRKRHCPPKWLNELPYCKKWVEDGGRVYIVP